MKTIKVLVIDDMSENLKSAEVLIQHWNTRSAFLQEPFYERQSILERLGGNMPDINIDPTFVNTGEKALQVMQNKSFDLVLSDLFLDYNEKETSLEIREKIKNILGPYGVVSDEKLDSFNQKQRARKESWHQIAKGWYEGQSQVPPTGVLIAEFALNLKIPFIFCTSTYHHSSLGEPVNQWSGDQWSGENKISYIEGENHFKLYKKREAAGEESPFENPPVEYGVDITDKDWRLALVEGLKMLMNE